MLDKSQLPAAAAEEKAELDQARREKVFLAAKELFGRYGFKKTTADEIAEQAGISKRTMYQVFRCKEQILAELVMFEALTFRHHCTKMLKTMDNPLEKLELFCRLSSDYFADNPFLGQVLVDDAGLFSPFLTNEMQLVESGIREVIARLLAEGMQKGVFRTLDMDPTVECILVLMRRFTMDTSRRPAEAAGWISFILNAVKGDYRRLSADYTDYIP